jgi:hypothetical protein
VYSEGDNAYPPMMTYDAAAGRVAFLAGLSPPACE